MSLRADQKDYKAAYLKHWSTYQKYRASGSKSSQRLLLAYSVECGLKYILMKREKIYQVSNAQDEIQSLLKTHDFRKLLKKLMFVSSLQKLLRDEITICAEEGVSKYSLSLDLKQ